MDIRLVWFDSLGAKSSCVYVETDDISVLIDPGVAHMQPSFPATYEQKHAWYLEAKRRIRRYARKAQVIVISHYHWDHFSREVELYTGKTIFAKNPNEYINDEQRRRALDFFSSLWKEHGRTLELRKPRKKKFDDVADRLRSVCLDFGDYQKRREELLLKGKKWFEKRAEKWAKFRVIPEADFGTTRVVYPEGKEYSFGNTKLKFVGPLFHGIEYSRVGWIFLTRIEHEGEVFVHSSDVSGPIIEDYADLIVELDPTYLVLDGPPTYMFGYMLNRINLNRAVENATRIVREADFEWMIYDHHLPREAKFRERTKKVWQEAERLGKKVLTGAEHVGKTPVILELVKK